MIYCPRCRSTLRDGRCERCPYPDHVLPLRRVRAASGLPRRVIRAAAALEERFQNPDVAAYGRLHFAEGRMFSGKFRKARASERRDQFWHAVGRALGCGPGCPTDYERAKRHDINEARAAIIKTTGSAS